MTAVGRFLARRPLLEEPAPSHVMYRGLLNVAADGRPRWDLEYMPIQEERATTLTDLKKLVAAIQSHDDAENNNCTTIKETIHTKSLNLNYAGVSRDKHPLNAACKCGHEDIVCLLIEEGANVNHPDGDGNTPLMCACVSRQRTLITIMNLLIRRGAQVSIRNKNDDTALHVAASSGSLDAVRFLLAHGACGDCEAVNASDLTPEAVAGRNLRFKTANYLKAIRLHEPTPSPVDRVRGHTRYAGGVSSAPIRSNGDDVLRHLMDSLKTANDTNREKDIELSNITQMCYRLRTALETAEKALHEALTEVEQRRIQDAQDQTLTMERARSHQLEMERDAAVLAAAEARRGQEVANQERDRAAGARDAAQRISTRTRDERDAAVRDRDVANEQRDAANRELQAAQQEKLAALHNLATANTTISKQIRDLQNINVELRFAEDAVDSGYRLINSFLFKLVTVTPYDEVIVDRHLRPIGRGANGTVFAAQWRGRDVVIKTDIANHGAATDILTQRQVTAMTVIKECATLASLNSPHIVKFCAMTLDIEGFPKDLVMERLQPLPARVERADICTLGAHICSGLSVMHRHNPVILHRDIKPANFLFDPVSRCYKISDLGEARLLREHSQSNQTAGIGTTAYQAPEMRIQKARLQSGAVDIFSCGMSLVELTLNETSNLPLSVSEEARAEDIARRTTNISEFDAVLGNWLARMVDPLSAARPSAEECRDFFLGHRVE